MPTSSDPTVDYAPAERRRTLLALIDAEIRRLRGRSILGFVGTIERSQLRRLERRRAELGREVK